MDNISNMLIKIKNAKNVKHPSVKAFYSKANFGIAQVLKEEGFIEDVQVKNRGPKQWLIITLKYGMNGESAISDVKRISKPGKRVYAQYKKIPKVKYGYGIAVVSTPKGIITGEMAKKEKVGGEILCKIW